MKQCKQEKIDSNGALDSTVTVFSSVASIENIEDTSVSVVDSDTVAVSISASSKKKKVSVSSVSSSASLLSSSSKSIEQVSSSTKSILAVVHRDTVKPYVYVVPPGGLYHKKIYLNIRSLENKTKIYYKIDNSDFIHYLKKIEIFKDCDFSFFGVDSAGNISDTVHYDYKFEVRSPCPANMAYVEEKNICVDKFEWPNKKMVTPQNFISLYAAQDSCFSVNKHLCSFDELKSAAGDNRYVYGQYYNINKCNTVSNKVSRSGFYGECRSYYGVYDLIGNLSEWTSTPSFEDESKNIIFGGNYASGSLATTKRGKFSYFPQNSYTNVGFRCCYDINKKE